MYFVHKPYIYVIRPSNSRFLTIFSLSFILFLAKQAYLMSYCSFLLLYYKNCKCVTLCARALHSQYNKTCTPIFLCKLRRMKTDSQTNSTVLTSVCLSSYEGLVQKRHMTKHRLYNNH